MGKTMSGTSGSIAMRLDSLETQLNFNKVRFLGSIIDLEDSIKSELVADYDPSITIEEFADDEGRLIAKEIPESVWVASIKRESDLDCRMIVNFQQPQELGLYRWTIVCCKDGKPVQYSVKVWIVPAPDDK